MRLIVAAVLAVIPVLGQAQAGDAAIMIEKP